MASGAVLGITTVEAIPRSVAASATPLRVVARARSDHGARLPGGQHVVRTPDLGRAGALQVLALEVDRDAGQLPQRGAGQQRSGPHVALDAGARGEHVVERQSALERRW
ncbi:MAG: hypothetical protein U0360_03050 [Dehalococcoidia bacterium]